MTNIEREEIIRNLITFNDCTRLIEDEIIKEGINQERYEYLCEISLEDLTLMSELMDGFRKQNYHLYDLDTLTLIDERIEELKTSEEE